MIKLEELTSPEVQQLLSDGWKNIIVPLGSTEQHGPGLPLCVDSLHGEETALRAAKELGKTLVAPTVTLGYSPEHVVFPGTISIRKETLSLLLEDIAENLVRSGFTFVYFWFGHGGDWAVAREVLPALRNRWAGCLVTFTEDVGQYVAETWDKKPLEEGIPLHVSGSHAGEFETSMMAAIRPDLVKKEKLAAGDARPLNEIMEQMMTKGIHTVSKNGVLGDQREADAERGNRYLDCLADWLIKDIQNQKEKL